MNKIPLGELMVGTLFRDGNGQVLLTDGRPENDLVLCRPCGVRGSRRNVRLPADTPVTPVDVVTLLRRIERLEQENREMAMLVHDRREDYGHWIEQGAAQERGMCASIIAQWSRRTGVVLTSILDAIVGRGKIMPQLPPDRLWEENQKLKGQRFSGADPQSTLACDWCHRVTDTVIDEVWSEAAPEGHLVRLCASCRSSCGGG